MLRALAQAPTVHHALSQGVMPHALDSAAFARRKLWWGYMLLAALVQGGIGSAQVSAGANLAWMLATFGAILGVVVFFRWLPGHLAKILASVDFPAVLVYQLSAGLTLRPWRCQTPSCVFRRT